MNIQESIKAKEEEFGEKFPPALLKSNMEKIKCKRCGSMATKGEYEDGVIDYFCKKCDITFFDNEEQTIIS